MVAIWTEKYRPKRLADVVGQKTITERLEAFVRSGSIPHCLFAGPAGIGKTTCALAIAREFFGDKWQNNFLEMNASDERGIDTIRVKVKDFARTMSLGGGLKIIYLDEADSLTRDAQHALRRTMEKYSNTSRFIFSVNYSSKIIPPIQSRTAVFRFSPLKEDDIMYYLRKIAASEELIIDDTALENLIRISRGDMRRAINILQTASILGKKITNESIASVTSSANPSAVRQMLEAAVSGNFMNAKKQLNHLIYDRGLSGEDLIKEIHMQVLELVIPDKNKLDIIQKVGECEFRLTEGSDPHIQLEALLAQISLLGS